MSLIFNYFSNTLNSEPAFSETILFMEISWKNSLDSFSVLILLELPSISCSCFLKILWYHIILLMNPHLTSLDLIELKCQIHRSIYPLGSSFIYSTKICWVPPRQQGMGYVLRLTWNNEFIAWGWAAGNRYSQATQGFKMNSWFFFVNVFLNLHVFNIPTVIPDTQVRT